MKYDDFDILRDHPLKKLHVGDILDNITAGFGSDTSPFIWERPLPDLPPKHPKFIKVVEEYDRFYVLEPHFENPLGEETSHRECVLKADLYTGFVTFKRHEGALDRS